MQRPVDSNAAGSDEKRVATALVEGHSGRECSWLTHPCGLAARRPHVPHVLGGAVREQGDSRASDIGRMKPQASPGCPAQRMPSPWRGSLDRPLLKAQPPQAERCCLQGAAAQGREGWGTFRCRHSRGGEAEGVSLPCTSAPYAGLLTGAGLSAPPFPAKPCTAACRRPPFAACPARRPTGEVAVQHVVGVEEGHGVGHLAQRAQHGAHVGRRRQAALLAQPPSVGCKTRGARGAGTRLWAERQQRRATEQSRQADGSLPGSRSSRLCGESDSLKRCAAYNLKHPPIILCAARGVPHLPASISVPWLHIC